MRLFCLTTTDRFLSNWPCIPRWAFAFGEPKAINSGLFVDLDKNLTIEWHKLHESSKNTTILSDRFAEELVMWLFCVCMTPPPDF